jgi:hypothetical protein
MTSGRDEINWGQRVPKWKLRRLYESDAQGLLDEDLLNDVGYTLLERCRDILKVASAQHGQVPCPRCERLGQAALIPVPRVKGDPRDRLLTCPVCGWQITWGEYHLSYKRKQLNPGGATDTFAAFAAEFPQARTPQAKMAAIDRLIHEFHYSFQPLPDIPTRPVGVNLIEGHLEDVIAFLNELTIGDAASWQAGLAVFRTAGERIHQHVQNSKKKARPHRSPP